MKTILLILLCVFSAIPVFTQEQPVTLTEADKREVLFRLVELGAARKEVELQRQYIARDDAQDTREAELAKKAVEYEAKLRELAERERDVAREQATQYKQSYEVLANQKVSVGCRLKKILSLNLARCR